MWGGVCGGRGCKRVIAEPVLPCLGPWTRSQVSPHPSPPTCTVGFLTTLLIRSWNPCLKKCGTKRVLKLPCLCLLVAPKLSGTCGGFWPALKQVCTSFGRGPYFPPTSAGSHSPRSEGSVSVCCSLGSSPGIRRLGDFQFSAEHAGAVEITSWYLSLPVS